MSRSFNGSSDQILTSAYAVPAAITLSCWINRGSLSNAYNGILCHDGGSGMVQILIKSTNKVAYYCQATGLVFIDPGTATISAVWTHIALVYDSVNGLATYVNGASDGTAAANGALNTSSSTLGIGFDPSNAGRNLPGVVADCAEWNTNLTAAEIKALANGARPYTIRPASLNGWWPLDGLQSPEPDLSGKGHNGTLTGTSLGSSGAPVMLFTPRWPQTLVAVAATGSIKFRRTLSALGTRGGSRQAMGAA